MLPSSRQKQSTVLPKLQNVLVINHQDHNLLNCATYNKAVDVSLGAAKGNSVPFAPHPMEYL